MGDAAGARDLRKRRTLLTCLNVAHQRTPKCEKVVPEPLKWVARCIRMGLALWGSACDRSFQPTSRDVC